MGVATGSEGFVGHRHQGLGAAAQETRLDPRPA